MRHKLTALLACGCALVALLSAATLQADPGPDPQPTTTDTTSTTTTNAAPAPDLDLIERLIQRHRQDVWRWERVMGRPLTRALPNPPVDPHSRVAAWHRLAVNMHRRVGSRAGAPLRPRLLSVAEHRSLLRPDLITI